MKHIGNILGIVIYEKTIAVAEIERPDSTARVCRSAEYMLPAGISIDNLAATGNDFRAFLKTNNMKSKKAIVGIPARQMMATTVKLPAVNNNELRNGALRLNLERQLNIDISELAFDYYDGPAANNDSVLVAAVLKKTITQIQDLFAAAKITSLQITNTSLALDLRTSDQVHCHLMEFPHSVEICLFNQNQLTHFQYVSKEPDNTLSTQTAQKISRIVNRSHWGLSSSTESVRYSLWGHDHARTINQDIQTLLGKVESSSLEYTLDTLLCSYAAELGCRYLSSGPLQINYLNGHHPRGEKHTLLSKWLKKAIGVAAGIVLLIAVFLISWQIDRYKIIKLSRQLDSIKGDVAVAEKIIDQVTRARPWFQTTPVYLEMLRELTLSFPENSNIWLTSLAVDESSKQVLKGRATREDAVLDVVDKLKASRHFEDVRILRMQKMGKETDIMTFEIELRYLEGN